MALPNSSPQMSFAGRSPSPSGCDVPAGTPNPPTYGQQRGATPGLRRFAHGDRRRFLAMFSAQQGHCRLAGSGRGVPQCRSGPSCAAAGGVLQSAPQQPGVNIQPESSS